jgi:hypothetical protein
MSDEQMDLDTAIEASLPTENEPEVNPKDDGDGAEKGSIDEKGDEANPEKVGEKDVERVKKEGEDEDGDPDKNKADPSEKPLKHNRADKRIDELLKDRYELRRKISELESKIKPDVPEPPKKPESKDFEFDPKDPESVKKAQREFDFAMGKYESDLKSHKDKVAATEAEKEDKERARIDDEKSQYAARIEEGKKEYPDYDKAFRNIADSFEMTEALHETLLESKDPAGLLRFLGLNTGIAEKILSLPTARQAIKLAEIDVKLKYAKERKLKVSSSAPAPAAKVAGSGGAKKDPSNMSAQEYYDTYVKKKKT